MGKLFNVNSPFWSAMGRIFDVFVLNIMWLLCCIPIVTIGPATTAMFYGLFGIIRGDGGYPSKDFIKSFKLNLKQGILLGLPLTLVGAFLALDIYLCYHAGRGIYSFFLFFFLVLFILWTMVTLYAFPILAKFERTNKEILIWAFTASIKNLLKTIYMLIILVAAIWICRIIPGLIFIAFGLAAETQTAILNTILSPYLPAVYQEEAIASDAEIAGSEEAGMPDDIDPWLL